MFILNRIKSNIIGTTNSIYLIFPILSLTVLGYKGSLWLGILVTVLFIISYLMMIYMELEKNRKLGRILLAIHLIGVLYFIYFFSVQHCMFFFYGAYVIPYAFRVKFKSIETYMYLSTMVVATIIIGYLDYADLFLIIPFWVIVIMIMIGNFKTIETSRLQDEIRSKNEHINVLITEQERNRIGQDLHDTLGHVFASLSVKSELAMKLIDKDVNRARQEMASVNKLSQEALAKVRAIVDDLKVQSFEEEVVTMQDLLENANLSFEFEHAERAKSLSPTKQSTLSMILREAVNNVIKHANATKVYGKIIEDNHNLKLMIQDDGCGMNSVEADDFKSIKDRVSLLNGSFEVNEIKDGLKITISLPRGDGAL